ncbi:MAG: cytochrome c oxidase accessory protein CcoG [bacterium]|nr:cytochrome c oxidase accessory protein CcoG [bacterium]
MSTHIPTPDPIQEKSSPNPANTGSNGSMQSSGHRQWQYPDRVPGRWTIAREGVGYALLGLFLLLPWLTINGNPALLLNIPERKFFIFGATFVPGDFFLFALLMLLATLALFLFSALFGRIWCGWACPQTVFMEGVYRQIERMIEGSFRKRKARDEAKQKGQTPTDYYMVKGLKHAIYLVISFLFGMFFLAYFVGRDTAFGLLSGTAGDHPFATFALFALSGFMYFVGAIFRELACTFICPYARFQSVLLDRHSIVIGYDKVRGEPRGKRKRGSESLTGDCVDCFRCVQVCPTGIDIRNGLQLECVNCTACLDACDEVMLKTGKPKGLIRYGSTAALEGEPTKKLLRPRTILYTLILLGVVVLATLQLSNRQLIHAVVLRAAGMPYVLQPDGKVRNGFIVKLENRGGTPRTINITAEGLPGAEWIINGAPFALAAGQELRVNVYGIVPRSAIKSEETTVTFRITQEGELLAEREARFLSPEVDEDDNEKDEEKHH